MTYEVKDNTGSLWLNDKKDTDSHPDRTGSIMVDGKEYWINGWLKKTKDGKTWLSLSVKPKQERQAKPAPARPKQAAGDFEDFSDAPF